MKEIELSLLEQHGGTHGRSCQVLIGYSNNKCDMLPRCFDLFRSCQMGVLDMYFLPPNLYVD